MADQKEVESLVKSLIKSSLAASEADALKKAEGILGVSTTSEKRFGEKMAEGQEPKKIKQKEKPVKLEDIEPVEKKEICGFKEIPVEKKERKGLSEEEKKGADLSRLFYCGKK